METLFVTVANGNAASALSSFLGTIDYVEQVRRPESDMDLRPSVLVKGEFSEGEKPSDFARIWKKRKKNDAKQLRKRAWKN